MRRLPGIQTPPWPLRLLEEVLTWGSGAALRVRGRIFANGGDEATAVSVTTSLEEQDDLPALDPETTSRAACVGRFGWSRDG